MKKGEHKDKIMCQDNNYCSNAAHTMLKKSIRLTEQQIDVDSGYCIMNAQ